MSVPVVPPSVRSIGISIAIKRATLSFTAIRSSIQVSNRDSNFDIGGRFVDNIIEALQKASAPSGAHDSAQRYPAPKCIEGTRIELLTRLTPWVDEPDEKAI